MSSNWSKWMRTLGSGPLLDKQVQTIEEKDKPNEHCSYSPIWAIIEYPSHKGITHFPSTLRGKALSSNTLQQKTNKTIGTKNSTLRIKRYNIPQWWSIKTTPTLNIPQPLDKTKTQMAQTMKHQRFNPFNKLQLKHNQRTNKHTFLSKRATKQRVSTQSTNLPC